MTLEIYVASAGTGKTSKLAQLLEEALLGTGDVPKCRPEAVLATTFTRQAAAELRERARVQLLSHDHFEAAQQLNAAMIGTVNSVCGRIISDFAMELGLSPEVRVIDENEAAAAMEVVLSQSATAEEQHEIAELARTMTELTQYKSPLTWFESVRKIVELARANGISAVSLDVSKHRSVDTLLQFLGPPLPDDGTAERSLEAALVSFVNSVDLSQHKTKSARDALTVAQEALDTLRKGWHLPWHQWVKLANLDASAKLREAVAPLHEAAQLHDRHPRLQRELSRAVELIFAIAKRALDDYQQYKNERGVIDFVDQEVLALQALDVPAIQDELKHRIDLVLVDEFQDTSPLQLAIFLKLAELAPRGIWVGDQKQAIYSFRGTDPALMNAAIDELEDDGNGELVDRTLAQLTARATVHTLRESWRSRPDLVRLTSKLFSEAFAHHDIPRDRVCIEPGHPQDDPALGPLVEHWKLQINSAAATRQLPGSVAAGVQQLLGDKNARVRDRTTQATRPVQVSDIGILCRTNSQCQDMAAALTALGIPAQVPRVGVFSTPEGCALLAALQLWYDPTASLPKAELARLMGETTDPSAWINIALAPEQKPFENDPSVRALLAARDAAPCGDILTCFDSAIEAINLREQCLAWGDAPQRLGNIDAMRAHAEAYLSAAQSSGDSATLVGLLYHLIDVAEDGRDAWAHADEGSAATVTTWHASKGLEWPIVVLFGMEPAKDRPLRTLGARAETPDGPINLREVLKDRWIRYWTTPYMGANTKTPFYERLTAHPLAVNAKVQQEREELRLLYVGWTRARDRLVLATHDHGDKFSTGMLRHLNDGKESLVAPFEGTTLIWGGMTVAAQTRTLTGAAPVLQHPRPSLGYAIAQAAPHPRAYALPSSLSGIGRFGPPATLGPRMQLRGGIDARMLGQAVHAFLAADDPAYDSDARRATALEIAQAWGVGTHVDAKDLLAASDRLRKWANERWKVRRWLREVPMRAPDATGTVVYGRADLVLETEDGYVVVDHKSSAGADGTDAEQRAALYAGQLSAYGTIIAAATGKPVLGCFVYVPLAGTVSEVMTERSGDKFVGSAAGTR